MELELQGRTALVTGAAGGIGAAVARALVAEGAHVVLADRQPESVAALAKDIGAAATAVVPGVDVTKEDDVARAVAAAVDAGGLDLVVHCAGVSGPVGTPLTETSLEQWRQVLEVNVQGAFLVLKHAFAPLSHSDAGAVVMIASDSALVSAPGMAPYCASKAALLQLARATAVEWADSGVRVNAVCPSVVDTPMSRGDLGLTEGFGGVDYPVQSAGDVARQVLFLCSPLSASVNAAAYVSDYGWSARSSFPA